MSSKSKRNFPRGRRAETCACGCGKPLRDGQKIVVVDSQDGTKHWHCSVCGQPFIEGQDIQTGYGYYTRSGEEVKLPMHLECAAHA